MAYLTKDDFYTLSREDQVETLTKGDDAQLAEAEASVVQEITSYLNPRYNMTGVFPNVNNWNYTTAYSTGSLVYVKTENVWSATVAYVVGDLACDNATSGHVYRCIQAGTNHAFDDAAYWTLIGKNKGHYKAKVDAIAGTSPADTGSFTEGDTRFPLIKRIVIDMVLYQLCTRINPRNIPEYRIQKRDDAVSWLNKVSNPKMNVNAEFLTLNDYGDPKKSNNISWNSNPKRSSKY